MLDVAALFPQARVDADVAVFKSPLAARYAAASVRLRFDKVALEFVSHMQRGLRDHLPPRKTLVVTITAPIRQGSKTASELETKIRTAVLMGDAQPEFDTELNGNHIRVCMMNAACGTQNVLGFVHNPDSDVDILVDAVESMLQCVGGAERVRERARWLVISNETAPAKVELFREIYRQFESVGFRKTFMVFEGGRVEELSA